MKSVGETAFSVRLASVLGSAPAIRHYAPHQDLFLQGDEAGELHIVQSGRIKLWRQAHDGAATTLLLLGAGEVLGSVAVAQECAQLTSATALDAVAAAAWPARLVREALHADPMLADLFLQTVARRAVQLMDRFEDVAGLPVEARLVRLLLRLSAEYGRHDDDLAVVFDLRQQDLAEIALTTVPSVSRILSEWRAGGFVATKRGKIVVPHLSRLASMGGVHLD